MKIIKRLFAISLFLSIPYYVYANEPASHAPHSLTEITHQHLLVQAYPENDQDSKLLRLLEETKTFHRIKNIVSSNFNLNTPIQFAIKHVKDIDPNDILGDKQDNIIHLSFSFLHTLHQGLLTKYEHQPEVVDTIFSASAEFYLWSEFADFLITEKQFEIFGDHYATKDNFAAVMLLNQNNPNGDYIADASEAYLLIRSMNTFNLGQRTKSELQLDQLRYKHIICLTIGFDQIIQNPDIDRQYLDSFSWDKDKIEQCKNSYRLIMKNWYQAISPSLKENSVIHHWINLL